MSAIVVENLSKRFRLQTDRAHSVKELVTRRDRSAGADQFWALRDVSLEIPEGSMYALIGHNGCGKSTLLRCMAGIYRPSEGSVSATGRISTLLELGAGFHPDLTGRENVYMNATILGMGRKQIDAVFDEIVEFAGVGDFIDSPVKIYSSGMYVRLGFSVAVHVDPEILIIDEVIAVGDEEFQRRCFDHLYDLRKKGVTVVVVTHGMDTVQTMCDSALWLDHGVPQKQGDANLVAQAYLQSVNEREAAERLVSTQRDDLIVDGAATTSAHGQSQLGKEISIEEVWFCGSDGTPTEVVNSGEPFELHIVVDALATVDEPVFGYGIHAENGAHVAGSNTKLDGMKVGSVSGTKEIIFSMDELDLLPGNFEFTIGINDKFVQHVFDRHDRQYSLAVRRGTDATGAGFVRLGGNWSLEDR